MTEKEKRQFRQNEQTERRTDRKNESKYDNNVSITTYKANTEKLKDCFKTKTYVYSVFIKFSVNSEILEL